MFTSTPANIDDVEGLALIQKGKPQTRSEKCQITRCINIISDFSHQDYKV